MPIMSFLAQQLSPLSEVVLELKRRDYTYRIVFIPETIGSITYLSLHHDSMKKNIVSGFNVSCVGDDRSYSYLPSRDGNTLSDRIARHVLKHTDTGFKNIPGATGAVTKGSIVLQE